MYESKFAEEDDGDEEAAEIRVDVKQEESRPVADPRENSTNKKRRSSYSGTEFAPHMRENESSTHQTTKSIKDPRDSAAPAFDIAEDSRFVASKPASLKPTAMFSRRKSLAAVSAMLDSIVDDTGADKENTSAPKRRNIDIGRVLRSKNIEPAKLDARAADPTSTGKAPRRESLLGRKQHPWYQWCPRTASPPTCDRHLNIEATSTHDLYKTLQDL